MNKVMLTVYYKLSGLEPLPALELALELWKQTKIDQFDLVSIELINDAWLFRFVYKTDVVVGDCNMNEFARENIYATNN